MRLSGWSGGGAELREDCQWPIRPYRRVVIGVLSLVEALLYVGLEPCEVSGVYLIYILI